MSESGEKSHDSNGSERREERDRSRSPRRDRSRSRSNSPRGGRSESRDDIATIYISGLSSKTRASDLQSAFAKHGKVASCQLITDPRNNESRGFAFVTMETAKQADDAIYNLHRTEMDGRVITVEKEN